MDQEQDIDLGWGAFASRLFLILVWMAASPIVGAAARSEDLPLTARAVAGCLVALPACVWVIMLGRRRKKVDEFDGELITTALSSGAIWALMFGPLWLAGNAIGAAVGFTSGISLEKAAFNLLCILPAAAAFQGESAAQVMRWRFAKGLPPKGGLAGGFRGVR